MSGRLIAQSGTLPDGRSYTVYRGSALRWIGPYPCEAGNRPHDLGEPEPRPWGAAGCSRPIQAGCRICGSIVTVGWTVGPVFFSDEAAYRRWAEVRFGELYAQAQEGKS